MIKEGTITTLASMGYDEVKVASLPSVALITTGDEIVPVHATVTEVQIRNSNQHLLKALLRRWEIKPTAVAHVKDDAAAFEKQAVGTELARFVFIFVLFFVDLLGIHYTAPDLLGRIGYLRNRIGCRPPHR